MEFDANVEFTCGGNTGKFKIRDINAQELDFEVYELRMDKTNDKVGKVREYFKIFMKKKIEEKLRDVNDVIMKVEANPEKLQQDKENREKNAQETQKVRDLTGAEKERLLKEQKEKDRQFKEQEFLRAQSQN